MPIPYPYKRIRHKKPEKEKIMRVRMARDWEAAFDGNNFQKLKAGESYDIPESFAKRYLEKGIAFEDKAIDKVPETKVRTAKKPVRKKTKK